TVRKYPIERFHSTSNRAVKQEVIMNHQKETEAGGDSSASSVPDEIPAIVNEVVDPMKLPPLPPTPAATPTATPSATPRKSSSKRNVSKNLSSRFAKFEGTPKDGKSREATGADVPKASSQHVTKSHLNASNHSHTSVASAVSLPNQGIVTPNGSPVKKMRQRPSLSHRETPTKLSPVDDKEGGDVSVGSVEEFEPLKTDFTPGGSQATPLSAKKRSVVATKLSDRVTKFDANRLDGALLSPMQLDAVVPNISIAGPPLTADQVNEKELSLSPMHVRKTVPKKRRSERHKKIEDKAQLFDSPTPQNSGTITRVLLSPQEVRELIKSSNTNHRLDQLLYRYEHLSEEESNERRRLAAKISAKERWRRLGTSTGHSEARKLAWEQSRARFQEGASGRTDTATVNLMLYGPSLEDTGDKDSNIDIFDEVRGVSYDFSDFTPPMHAKTDEQRALILEAVEKEFPFVEFRPGGKAWTLGATDALVAAFEPVHLPVSEVLLHQDVKEGNDKFYILENGAIDVHKDGVSVGQLESIGETFGQLALLYYAPSNVTISVASSSAIQGSKAGAQLLKIDQKTYRGLLHTYAEKARKEKQDALLGVEFLHNLVDGDEGLCTRLCSVMVRQEFNSSDVFDAPEDATFFIVQTGQMRAISKDDSLDMELTAGSYFGERSLIGSLPRRANPTSETTIVAQSEGVLFSIDKRSMEQILGRGRLENVKDMRQLASTALVKKAKLSRALRSRMANRITELKLKADDKKKWRVEKSQQPALYVVREGSVVVSYDDEETGKARQSEVKAGEVFGHEQVTAIISPTSGTTYRRIGGLTTTSSGAASIGILPLQEAKPKASEASKGPMIPAITGKEDTLRERIHENSQALQLRKKIRDAVKGNVSLDELEKIRLLGEGEYGEVWMVAADVFRTGVPELRQKFALKSQLRMDITRGKDASADILREIKILSEIDHPQVVNLVNTYQDEESIHILMDLIPGGELWDFIHREDNEGNWKSGISEDHAKFVTMVVADTLDFIHGKDIIFRDLKPGMSSEAPCLDSDRDQGTHYFSSASNALENIMIDAVGYPVLVDFGFAKHCPEKTYTFVGTPNYVSPEVITNAGHNRSVDYWALGVTVYEALTGENPFFFDGMDQASLYHAICEEKYYPLPESSTKTLLEFVDMLLKKKPTDRLGMLARGVDDIFEHPWLEGLDLDRIRSKEWPSPWMVQHQSEDIAIEDGVLKKLGMSVLPPSLDESTTEKDDLSTSLRDPSERDHSASSIAEGIDASVHSVSEVDDSARSDCNPTSESTKVQKKKKKAKSSKKKKVSDSPRKKSTGDVTSQYQFVTPTTETFFSIKTPGRKKKARDLEASNNRRSALKGKLRNLGIDSDEDLDEFDFLSRNRSPRASS
ncbi:MAG: hypothetical protein SGILL_003195, partial [Bacillariaceae sp.]